MQAATSLRVTLDEMGKWKYTLEGSLQEFETVAIQTALEHLLEQGLAAQNAMIRAERTLERSDPKMNMLSTGSAGPELLVSVLLHNLHMKPLIPNVELDVNQLYQKYAVKLVSTWNVDVGRKHLVKLTEI